MIHGYFLTRIDNSKTEAMSITYLRRTEEETRWDRIKN
jgi:hypothetical protein